MTNIEKAVLAVIVVCLIVSAISGYVLYKTITEVKIDSVGQEVGKFLGEVEKGKESVR